MVVRLLLSCVLSGIALPAIADEKTPATSAQQLQQEALQMLQNLPSGTDKQKATQQLQKLFDYYGNLNQQQGSPRTEASVPKVETRTVNQDYPQDTPELHGNSALQEMDFFEAERDPFALSAVLKRSVPRNSKGSAGAEQSQSPDYQFQRMNTGIQLPKLVLKALIIKSPQDKAAVLEISGLGSYVVREGDTVSLPQNGFNNVIKVSKIDRLSLLIEVGKLGEVIVVR
jgi:hypothetical protein